MAVAVIIKKGCPRVPLILRLKQAGFLGDVGEGTVSVVAV